MRRTIIPILSFFMTACSPPPEAPSSLEDLSEYIFTHMDDEDPEELQAGLENLDTWLNTGDNLINTIEGYQINNLKDESVANLDDEARSIQETLVGASVAHSYQHDMKDLIKTLFVDDWSKVSGGNYYCYERIFDDSKQPSCLLDNSCDWASYQTTSVSSWAGLVTVESKNSGQVRLVETEHGTAILQRTWLNEPAETSGFLGDSVSLHAQYYIGIMAPTSNGSILRTSAIWFDGEFPIEDENFAKNQIISQMQKQDVILTEWIEGDKDTEAACLCSNFDYEEQECPE
jgi:hypothetical protein